MFAFIKEHVRFQNTKTVRCIIRTISPGCNFFFFKTLVAEVKKDFPSIDAKDLDVHHYGGKLYKKEYGLEFNIVGTPPEMYQEISAVKSTLLHKDYASWRETNIKIQFSNGENHYRITVREAINRITGTEPGPRDGSAAVLAEMLSLPPKTVRNWITRQDGPGTIRNILLRLLMAAAVLGVLEDILNLAGKIEIKDERDEIKRNGPASRPENTTRIMNEIAESISAINRK